MSEGGRFVSYVRTIARLNVIARGLEPLYGTTALHVLGREQFLSSIRRIRYDFLSVRGC